MAVVIVGALDTKGEEFRFVKELIEARGLNTLVVDFGIMGEPRFAPDVPRAEVAAAAGADLEHLRSGKVRDEAIQAMVDGLPLVVRRLYDAGKLDAILGMGGGGGTAIATAGMRALPIGVPKVMLSTTGGDARVFVGSKDITMIPSIVDVAGFNRISRRAYAKAAGAVVGMLALDVPAAADDQPLIAASMFGNTTPCVDRARGVLEAAGYEVLVFHATGIGGRTMETMIGDGLIDGCLDVTTTELADEVCGGGASAGPERGLAASRAGIPAVIVPGCVDMANFGAPDTVPERYRGRNLYQWTPTGTLLRTNAAENRQIGAMIAAAANAATAPVTLLLPLKGVSMLDSAGGAFWDPEADGACFDAIRDTLAPHIPVIEMDCNINDPPFAERAATTLLELLAARAAG